MSPGVYILTHHLRAIPAQKCISNREDRRNCPPDEYITYNAQPLGRSNHCEYLPTISHVSINCHMIDNLLKQLLFLFGV